MDEDEQVRLEEIYEAVGIAAAYLMNSRLPVTASNTIMLLRAQGVMATDKRQKQIFAAAKKHLLAKIMKPL